MLRLLVLGAGLLWASVAQAQQIDHRISAELVQALQAQLALQQAMLRAREQDLGRICTLLPVGNDPVPECKKRSEP